MTGEQKHDLIASWRIRLSHIASEMEHAGEPQTIALAEHIDSIMDDLLFQQQELFSNGPIVTFKGFRP